MWHDRSRRPELPALRTGGTLPGLVMLALTGSALAAPPAARSGALLRASPGETQLIGCDRAAERITLESSAELDPACTYTGGFDIVRSGVVLDCRGARIQDTTGSQRLGIAVAASTDVALSDITVRSCVIEGFLNNIRVTRSGFKTLPEGGEYTHAYTDIVIEDSELRNSRGSGIFVDGYVTGVTLRNLEIHGSGSVGVYLEAGSKDNVVEGCYIHENGYKDVDPEGIPLEVGDYTFRYLSTGREGIAIDGSRNNQILDNTLERNSAGGIFLYKNCGEYATENPSSWWERRYGADGNLIEGNTLLEEDHGVWIGSRMAQNQYFMDCSDPAYIDYPLVRVHLDYAAENVVRDNIFENVGYGIRIEDDRALIEGNSFTSENPRDLAVVLGTMFRTNQLGLPVSGTEIIGNVANIGRNTSPFVWIHEHDGTSYADNISYGRPVALRRGKQPPMSLHLFVEEIWLER